MMSVGFKSWALAPLALLAGFAAKAEPLVFDGWVEAVHHGVAHSRAEGIVSAILVSEGDWVEAGEPLVQLRSDLAKLDLEVTEATLASRLASLEQAKARLIRAERLSASGTTSDVAINAARTEVKLAEAAHAAALAQRDLAQVRLDDTVIRAPIAGYVEQPAVRLGAFIEADASGAPLFEIVALDPVRIAYEVPYSERLDQMANTGAADAQALLARVTLEIATPDGRVLAQGVTPDVTSVQVSPTTGMLRVMAGVDNSDGLLRPGMRVQVLSDIDMTEHEASK